MTCLFCDHSPSGYCEKHTRRKIVSTREAFFIHDYTGEPVYWVCSEGCPGHDVRQLACSKAQKELNAIGAEAAVQHAAEDAELIEREAADVAEDKYLDQLDTLGGASPHEHRADIERER